ncbi:hypothetical protein MJO29_013017 [Puccinia striiformis f. sp. tritici]|nr:hypothetical protein MJO29_013017 [Puccinia striiformis f. sp. tritici]
MKQPCPASTFPSSAEPTYPLIHDIYDVVPLPWTQEIPAPAGTYVHPNALQIVRKVGGAPATFPNPIHYFSIPGKTSKAANAFIDAMQETVYWTVHKRDIKDTPPVVLTGEVDKGGFHVINPDSRKSGTSQKCGCGAKFIVRNHTPTNTLQVEWHWVHNHNPYSEEEMATRRTPKVIAQWINKRVISGLEWASIEKLLSCPESRPFFENVFKSLIMWNNQLIQEDYNTFLPIKTDEAGYIFVFQSNWQKNMLIKYGGSMLMLNATHNTVSNYGFGSKKDKENKQKISLYTFLIRDPIIGKGLPVCWAFTLLLAKAYKDLHEPPQHYWCLLHVFKAFKTNAIAHLAGGAEEAFAEFHKITYNKSPPKTAWPTFIAKWAAVSPSFVHNADQQWYINRTHWSMHYGTSLTYPIPCTDSTPGYPHKQLYGIVALCPQRQIHRSPERRRLDELVQILKTNCVGYFQRQSAHVQIGIQKQAVNKFQMTAKMAAKIYTPEILDYLGTSNSSVCSSTMIPARLSRYNPLLGTPFSHCIQFPHMYSSKYTPVYHQLPHKPNDQHISCFLKARRGSWGRNDPRLACKHMFYISMQEGGLVAESATTMLLEQILQSLSDQQIEPGPTHYDNQGTPHASLYPLPFLNQNVPLTEGNILTSSDSLCGVRLSVDLTWLDDIAAADSAAKENTYPTTNGPFSWALETGHGSSSADLPTTSAAQFPWTPATGLRSSSADLPTPANALAPMRAQQRHPASKAKPPLPSASRGRALDAKEERRVVRNLQSAGVHTLKEVEMLLRHQKVRDDFASALAITTMELLRDSARDLLSLVQEKCGLSQKQI